MTFLFHLFLRLLYDPVTVTCGHSFCLQCLNRTFDHSPFCPICRTPLGEVGALTQFFFHLIILLHFQMFSQHTNSAGQLVSPMSSVYYITRMCCELLLRLFLIPQPVDSTLISLIKHFFLCQYNEKSAQVIGDLIKRARLAYSLVGETDHMLIDNNIPIHFPAL